TYTSSSSFSCSRAFANGSGAVNCLGGCAYGQECREVDAVSNQGECKDVVPDPSLHACVSTMILSDDKVSGTSTTFSVASLKSITSHSLTCDNVAKLNGIEHFLELQNLNLDCLSGLSSFTSLRYLSTLTGLISLNLNSCSSTLDYIPELNGLFPYLNELDLSNISLEEDALQTISQFTQLRSLFLCNSNLSLIPDLSNSSISLQELDIRQNSISSLSEIFDYSLFSLSNLFADDNLIRDPSPLYILSDSLCQLSLQNNLICGIDEEYLNSFKNRFMNVICSVNSYVFAPQAECSCNEIDFISDGKVCNPVWEADGTIVYEVECSSYSYRVKDPSNDDGFKCIEYGSGEDSSGNSDIFSLCFSCNDQNEHMECVEQSSYDPSYSSISVECACKEGWYGENCDAKCPVLINDGNEDVCSVSLSQGECNTFSHMCECSLGWGGSNCADDQCNILGDSGVCSGNGECQQLSDTSSYCNCSFGFNGDICDERGCSYNSRSDEYCSGAGFCVKDTTGDYHCSSCSTGYVLDADLSDCLVLCDSEYYCGRHGVCVGENECICETGYSGAQCDEYTCGDQLDPCSSSTNHGSCSRLSYIEHSCVCELGWNGSNCDIAGCSFSSDSSLPSCGDYGECVQDSNVSQCICDAGWDSSTFCFDLSGECGDDSDSFCSLHGNCVIDTSSSESSCDCYDGWTGSLCETEDCGCDIANIHSECVDGAVKATRVCACKLGWSGDNCLDSACNCHSKGECYVNENFEQLCECNEYYTGDFCEECTDPINCLYVYDKDNNRNLQISVSNQWPSMKELYNVSSSFLSTMSSHSLHSVEFERSNLYIPQAQIDIISQKLFVIESNGLFSYCYFENQAKHGSIISDGVILFLNSVGFVFCSLFEGDSFICKTINDLDPSICDVSQKSDKLVHNSSCSPSIFYSISGESLSLVPLFVTPPCSNEIDGVVIRIYEDVLMKCLGESSSWSLVTFNDVVNVEFESNISNNGVERYSEGNNQHIYLNLAQIGGIII
ncbi:hypothetical protein ADUPG1_008160, partial [Aduncisulcus paluster]